MAGHSRPGEGSFCSDAGSLCSTTLVWYADKGSYYSDQTSLLEMTRCVFQLESCFLNLLLVICVHAEGGT